MVSKEEWLYFSFEMVNKQLAMIKQVYDFLKETQKPFFIEIEQKKPKKYSKEKFSGVSSCVRGIH